MKKILTPLFCRQAKPDGQQGDFLDDYPDELGRPRHGLIFRVSPQGKKTWVVRLRQGGRYLTRRLGGFPEMGLKEAPHEYDRLKAAGGFHAARLTFRRLGNKYVDE